MVGAKPFFWHRGKFANERTKTEKKNKQNKKKSS